MTEHIPPATDKRGVPERSYLWVWGKTDHRGVSRKAGGPAWNPLLAHALDTAAVAILLFDVYLAKPLRSLMVDTFGGGDVEKAKKVIALLAALHDIPGKACSGFQGGFHRSPPKNGLKTAAKHWEARARATGLPLAPDLGKYPPVAHAALTAQLLPALLGCSCRRRCGGDGEDSPALHMVADLLGGHHGHIPSLRDVRSVNIDAHEAWRRVHEELVDDLAQILEVERTDMAKTVVPPSRPVVLPAFAGLVVLADWIASNETFFTYRSPDDPVTDWWAASQEQAARAVRTLRLRRWQVERTGWATLFGEDRMPRPAQESVMRLLPETGPAMVIVEADTGSGKTEAAWWAAHHLTLTNGYHGMYMALPSRAATEQVGTRATGFVGASLSGDMEQANLAIVHGTAAASAVAEELLQAASVGPAVAVDGINVTCEDCRRAVLDDWFLFGKRGLLSPFGIGTVDQIVLAVQRSRFWFLRLFGLAQKVVVIDEAHAYELYQQTLLGEAVTWLADAGASVVVLSATLPRAVKETLVEAWCRGRRSPLTREAPSESTITVVDGEGRMRGETPPVSHSGRTSTRSDLLELLPPVAFPRRPKDRSFEHGWARSMLEQAREGGILAVLRNRVDSAVELYEAACSVAGEFGWDEETEIFLLHGRLLERDRNRVQQRLLDLLGPHPVPDLRATHPNPKRPRRLLVIATQVIEQSLDLDFDLMVSDLAPFDLLIQRRGRVRRHRVNDPRRPPLLDQVAPLRVLWLPDPEGAPLVTSPDNLDGAVYAPYLLAATWHVLTDAGAERSADGSHRREVRSDEVPGLIEAVYGDRLRGRTPHLEELLHRTRQEMEDGLFEERREAEERMVPAYSPRGKAVTVEGLASGWLNGEETDPGLPVHLSARSRLGADSYDILCLFRQADGGLTWDQRGEHVADLTVYDRDKQSAQYREQLRQLLLNTIRIPQRWFQQGKWPHPEEWAAVGYGPLRRPTLIFDPEGVCVQGLPGELVLTQRTGLRKANSSRRPNRRYRRTGKP
ncbi:CRISPR-associated helicase Cas3' [Streptosporangium sp. NPDC051022]|uniref:CRISPR-associated helicase Cas3' n=1 Tax=Streptosporangium sp. NPDC051022 TaxID=3155752 RepID=UPI00341B64D0